MSRVAKVPVNLPANVELTVSSDVITVKGPKGSLTGHKNILVDISRASENEREVLFRPNGNDPRGWAQAGTARANVANMVKGVTEGFKRTLELVGVGYRAQAAGSKLTISVGYSNPIEYTVPSDVSASTPNNTTIVLEGMSKQKVGQVAAEIRAFRPPEPYKGKGIKYAEEIIVRKEARKK